MGGIGYLSVGDVSISHIDGRDFRVMEISDSEFKVNGVYSYGKGRKVDKRVYWAQFDTRAIELAKKDGLVKLIKCRERR